MQQKEQNLVDKQLRAMPKIPGFPKFTGSLASLHFFIQSKNNFSSKNQEKYADPESTLFRHFLTKNFELD